MTSFWELGFTLSQIQLNRDGDIEPILSNMHRLHQFSDLATDYTQVHGFTKPLLDWCKLLVSAVDRLLEIDPIRDLIPVESKQK
jgi:hypothetical protein